MMRVWIETLLFIATIKVHLVCSDPVQESLIEPDPVTTTIQTNALQSYLALEGIHDLSDETVRYLGLSDGENCPYPPIEVKFKTGHGCYQFGQLSLSNHRGGYVHLPEEFVAAEGTGSAEIGVMWRRSPRDETEYTDHICINLPEVFCLKFEAFVENPPSNRDFFDNLDGFCGDGVSDYEVKYDGNIIAQCDSNTWEREDNWAFGRERTLFCNSQYPSSAPTTCGDFPPMTVELEVENLGFPYFNMIELNFFRFGTDGFLPHSTNRLFHDDLSIGRYQSHYGVYCPQIDLRAACWTLGVLQPTQQNYNSWTKIEIKYGDDLIISRSGNETIIEQTERFSFCMAANSTISPVPAAAAQADICRGREQYRHDECTPGWRTVTGKMCAQPNDPVRYCKTSYRNRIEDTYRGSAGPRPYWDCYRIARETPGVLGVYTYYDLFSPDGARRWCWFVVELSMSCSFITQSEGGIMRDPIVDLIEPPMNVTTPACPNGPLDPESGAVLSQGGTGHRQSECFFKYDYECNSDRTNTPTVSPTPVDEDWEEVDSPCPYESRNYTGIEDRVDMALRRCDTFVSYGGPTLEQCRQLARATIGVVGVELRELFNGCWFYVERRMSCSFIEQAGYRTHYTAIPPFAAEDACPNAPFSWPVDTDHWRDTRPCYYNKNYVCDHDRTFSPTPSPSDIPSTSPTSSPSSSIFPSNTPTLSLDPSASPSSSSLPTNVPTNIKSDNPSSNPTIVPTDSLIPTLNPTGEPSGAPSASPTLAPSLSIIPSNSPTHYIAWNTVEDRRCLSSSGVEPLHECYTRGSRGGPPTRERCEEIARTTPGVLGLEFRRSDKCYFYIIKDIDCSFITDLGFLIEQEREHGENIGCYNGALDPASNGRNFYYDCYYKSSHQCSSANNALTNDAVTTSSPSSSPSSSSAPSVSWILVDGKRCRYREMVKRCWTMAGRYSFQGGPTQDQCQELARSTTTEVIGVELYRSNYCYFYVPTGMNCDFIRDAGYNVYNEYTYSWGQGCGPFDPQSLWSDSSYRCFYNPNAQCSNE